MIIRVLKYIAQSNVRSFTLFLILGVALYGNMLSGPMLFDDELFIEKNVFVHTLDIKGIFSSGVTQGSQISGNFYRPLQQLVYSLLYQVFGLDPLPYRMLSLLVHILNTTLFFILFSRLIKAREYVLPAFLIYFVHPLHCESVSYISGLAEIMGTTLMAGALLVTVKNLSPEQSVLSRYLRYSMAALLFILSLLSKENMVVFVPLWLLILFFLNFQYKIKIRKDEILATIVFVVIAGIYVLMRFTILRFGDAAGLTDERNIYTENLSVRLITFISILWDYFSLLVFPLHLHYEKAYMAYTSLLTWRGAFGIALLIVLLPVFFLRKRYPFVFLGLFWFFICLLPYSGIVPLNAMFLEHWLYLPLAGLVIIPAGFVMKMNRSRLKLILVALFVLIMTAFSVRTFLRNQEWADIEKFYLNELKYTGKSTRIFNNLGMYYADHQMIDKAVFYYQKAIARDDRFPQPHHNLARLYYNTGKTPEAILELYHALRIDPGFVYSLSFLAQIYSESGQSQKAEMAYQLLMNARSGKRNSVSDIEYLIFGN